MYKRQTTYKVKDVVKKIERYTAYMGDEGGITVSGGEPLLQPEALITLFKDCLLYTSMLLLIIV